MKRRLAIRGFGTLVVAIILTAVVGVGVLLAANDRPNGEAETLASEESAGRDGAADTGAAATGSAAPRGSGRGGVRLVEVGRFDQPVFVTGAPGFRRLAFIVEKPGRVLVMNGNRVLRRPFLNITGRVSDDGEQGLLSIAFPPDYYKSGLFYVFYSDNNGDIRIDEFRRRTPVLAAPNTRRTVLRIPHREYTNHNGGQLAFLGPYLFIGTGDGGGGGDPLENAQDRRSLLGKLLRIDPRRKGARPYSVPRDNPFVGGGGRAEIYSYGLRNPWRFSFDLRRPKQPRIAIADVGQDTWEEVNYLTVAAAHGANFGWNLREGFEPYEGGGENTTPPIFVYGRDGGCSITGGHVVTDNRLTTLRGRYIFADFCQGRLRSLVPRLGRVRSAPFVGPSVASPTSFGKDGLGRTLVTSLSGSVYRLAPR